MRGGKYCKVVFNHISASETITYLTIQELHLLSKDQKRYVSKEQDHEFLNKEGQFVT
jgi:hypothetical protein